MNIYVGNMNFRTTEEGIRALFETYGQVDSVDLITDRETGKPKGFGFVTMPDNAEAQKAIEELNGKEHDGRALTVNEAKPKKEGNRPPRRDRY